MAYFAKCAIIVPQTVSMVDFANTSTWSSLLVATPSRHSQSTMSAEYGLRLWASTMGVDYE